MESTEWVCCPLGTQSLGLEKIYHSVWKGFWATLTLWLAKILFMGSVMPWRNGTTEKPAVATSSTKVSCEEGTGWQQYEWKFSGRHCPLRQWTMAFLFLKIVGGWKTLSLHKRKILDTNFLWQIRWWQSKPKYLSVSGFTVNNCSSISLLFSKNVYIKRGQTSSIFLFKGELDRWLDWIQTW